ncbi:hypothetical protein DL96DRAFT_1522553 [Flagelloscypha sp. PMI_526]|nr:hypothetical protein DL96DRAFT_1522553 [Flagelloscypha sp. PMI_526]
MSRPGYLGRTLSRSSFSARVPVHLPSRCAYRTLHLSSRTRGPSIPASRRWATSTTPHSSASDPAEAEALSCLDEGTQKLEAGDVEGAKVLYQRSADIRRNASSLFNLGVAHYHLKEYDEAIASWKESISLEPSSADAHTNLASAYIISPMPRPDLALHHLSVASSLVPTDGEVAFNYAAVLEACNDLDGALKQYQKSEKAGIPRASAHIRNVVCLSMIFEPIPLYSI